MADDIWLEKLLERAVINMNPPRTSERVDANDVLNHLQEIFPPDVYQQILQEANDRLKSQQKKELGRADLAEYSIDLLRRETYGQALYSLQQIYRRREHPPQLDYPGYREYTARPLTLRENLLVLVNDYENQENRFGKRTEADRLRFFMEHLDSCTGMIVKKNSPKFKIIPKCSRLIFLDRKFKKHNLPARYSSFSEAIELDSSKGKYDLLLTKSEILEHPGWIAVVEEDIHLLKAYADIIFATRYALKSMKFQIFRNDFDRSGLTDLVISPIDCASGIHNLGSLDNKANLLMLAR